jgi:hypothetical protein
MLVNLSCLSIVADLFLLERVVVFALDAALATYFVLSLAAYAAILGSGAGSGLFFLAGIL